MQANKRTSNLSQSFLWFGAAVSLAEILTGALIAPLGWGKGLAAILLGHFIGCAILYLAGLLGARSKLAAIESTQISFGKYGSYLFSILNFIQLVGWTGIMIVNGAKALNVITLSVFNYENQGLWCLLIAVIIGIWVVYGIKHLTLINNIAVAGLFIFTLLLGYFIFSSASLAVVPSQALSFGAALELSVVMPLSWLPLIADYTQHAKSERSSSLFSAGGYFLGSVFMYVIGLGAALYAGTSDISAILLAAGLPAIAFFIVLFSTVTTTFLDVHSAAVSFCVIHPVNKRLLSVLVCALGLAIALLIPTDRYESFLYLIGTAFAPLFAILLTDYFLLKKTKLTDNLLNIRNAFLWVVGVILYRVLLHMDTPLGSTLPTMVLLSALCIVIHKITSMKAR